MNYYSIKLKSGELFACQSQHTLNAHSLMNKAWIEIEHPIQFVSFKFADSESGEIIETVSMAPLVPISEDTVLTISTDSIILIASLRAAAIEKYCNFVERMDKYNEQGGDKYIDDSEATSADAAEIQEILDQLENSTKVIH